MGLLSRSDLSLRVARPLRLVQVLGLALLLLIVPRVAGVIAGLFDYSHVDPDGAFAWIAVHHVVQALIVLILMLLVSRHRGVRFGLGSGDRAIGLRWVYTFSLIFACYIAVSLLIVILAGTFASFPYPLTSRNIAGQLAFQLLLSGPSEELVFRAFAMTLLGFLVRGAVLKGRLSHANIIAAIIFALAHVSVTFAPISVSYDALQLGYAMVLGLAYGACYEQSKSVYYPMLMHSLSNVVAVGVTVVAGVWLG